jgi:AhpC/TSA family
MLLFAACSGGASPQGGDPLLSEGDRAPDFTLPSASGDQVALADLTDHKPALLYFSMGPG